jgi:hypothetical protein
MFRRYLFGLLALVLLTLPGRAELELSQLHGFNVGGCTIPADVTFQASAVSNSALTTYTHSSTALGPAAPDRVIVVGVGGRNTVAGRTIDTVTVAGITATPIATLEGGSNTVAGLFRVRVPTGTTGTISVTYSGSMARAGIGVWALYNLCSDVPTDIDTQTGANPSVTSSVQANGSIVGYLYASGASAGAWTGISEDFDDALTGPNGSSGASDDFASAANVAIQRSDTSTTDEKLLVASFR